MKITYKTTRPDMVPFVSINVGQTFFDVDGELCVKVSQAEGYNCVSLSLNRIYEVSDTNKVTPVHAELVVDGEEP